VEGAFVQKMAEAGLRNISYPEPMREVEI